MGLFKSGLMMLAVLAGLAMAGPKSVWAATPVVTDVRIGENTKRTRFVVEISKSVFFQVFTLPDPYRVVIDLPEVGWKLPPRPLAKGKGVISSFRYGLFQPGTSRLVIDLTGPAVVRKAFVLPGSKGAPARFVLDLAKSSRAVFVEQSRRQMADRAKNPRPSSKPTTNVAKPLATAVAVAPRLTPPAKAKPRKRVVVLDPGHGGVDPGAIGVSGVYEKSITLALAREVKTKLERTGNFKVVLTRDRDIFIRLRQRVAKSRHAGADLFVSLHADTIKNRSIRGASVYTLSERASDKEAAALAVRENKADVIGGVDLTRETSEVTNILIDLAQRETMNQSARFAATLVKQMKRKVKMLRNTHRFAGFAVLKAPDVPSVLIELGFLSNRNDEKNLRSRAYRSALAQVLARAIANYFTDVEQAQSR